MELVWDHTWEVLGADPSDGCRIMLTEPPLNSKANRMRMLEVRRAGRRRPCAAVQRRSVARGAQHVAAGQCHCKAAAAAPTPPPLLASSLPTPPIAPNAPRPPWPLQDMFETYGFHAAYVQVQAVLTLYSLGALTGLVVDSGDGVTHAVPVVDGYSAAHLTGRLNVAGRHITAYLADLLTRRGYSFNRRGGRLWELGDEGGARAHARARRSPPPSCSRPPAAPLHHLTGLRMWILCGRSRRSCATWHTTMHRRSRYVAVRSWRVGMGWREAGCAVACPPSTRRPDTRPPLAFPPHPPAPSPPPAAGARDDLHH